MVIPVALQQAQTMISIYCFPGTSNWTLPTQLLYFFPSQAQKTVPEPQ